jgi:hypothetical protein
MFTNMQEVAIETTPTSLEISPLPKQDRPDDFTGAIGKFQMEASVSPKKAGPGDPITLRVVVSGQGNFEAMGAPVLVGDEEWRSYPPSEKFQSSDAIHFVGEKTYEFMLVARTDQQQTPGIRFSYFDPDTGKYETLTQNPLPVQARAGAAPAQTAEATPDQKKAESPAPASTPNTAPMAKPGGTSRWTSLLIHPAFLMANAALGVLWVIGLLLLLLRRRAVSPAGLRRQKIQKLKSCLSTMESCSDSEFIPLAVRCLLTALDTESQPLNAGSLVIGLKVDEETKVVLTNLLVRDEESKYSAAGAQAIDRDSRSPILSALKKIVA